MYGEKTKVTPPLHALGKIDRDRYKRLQKEVQFHVRKANKTYMQDTVSNESKDNSKKFWSFVKSKGQ